MIKKYELILNNNFWQPVNKRYDQVALKMLVRFLSQNQICAAIFIQIMTISYKIFPNFCQKINYCCKYSLIDAIYRPKFITIHIFSVRSLYKNCLRIPVSLHIACMWSKHVEITGGIFESENIKAHIYQIWS